MSQTGKVGSRVAVHPGDNETGQMEPFRLKATYDFAVDGGAVGTIALVGSAQIPSGALVRDVVLNVITIPTSAGAATMALRIEGANDVHSASAFDAAPWSTTGLKAAGALKFGANPVKPTAARDISLVIGAFDLTAGKFEVLVTFEAPNF